jgi:hypothetical protein
LRRTGKEKEESRKLEIGKWERDKEAKRDFSSV